MLGTVIMDGRGLVDPRNKPRATPGSPDQDYVLGPLLLHHGQA